MPYDLTPVDHDPFAKDGAVSTTPVDGNPFDRSTADPRTGSPIPEAWLDRIRMGEAIKKATASSGKDDLDSFAGRATVEKLGESFEALGDTWVGRMLKDFYAGVSVPRDIIEGRFEGIPSGPEGRITEEQVERERMRDETIRERGAGFANIAVMGTGSLLSRAGILRAARGPVLAEEGGQFSRLQPGSKQTIGPLPTEADFATAADVLGSDAAKGNLRELWEERGIHPAEAVADARNDAFLRYDLTSPNPEPMDRSGIPPVRNSSVAEGTPRSELAKTGQEHIDRILDSTPTKQVIDNPVVDRTRTIPYTAGGSVPLQDPTFFIDRRFPESFTIDGITFDPAHPFSIHENLEQHTMELLIKAGMEPQAAYKVAHFEFAEKAEGAWYVAHGIDQAKAEAAYAPFMAQIQHEGAGNVPPNLYKRPYPHDTPSAAQHEAIAEPRPTKAEIAQAKAILDAADAGGEFRSLGAAATGEAPTLAQQPPHPPGGLVAAAQAMGERLFDIGRDLQMLVAPMARGTRDSMAIAKDFANAMRRNRWEWSRIDADIEKRFTPEQRKRMWDAADEESVAIQLGESREHQGLVTLAPEERAAVEALQTRAQAAWLRAVDLGMVEGEGLPAYTPRMVMNVATGSDRGGSIPLTGMGFNLRTQTGQMKHRAYLTAEETEAAAKRLVGLREALKLKSLDEIEGAIDAVRIARDIRTLPLATGRLEDAIAGRTLIDNIKQYGARTGSETVAEGGMPAGSEFKWFTIDHPSFRTWKPKFEMVDGTMQAARDANGDIIFQQVPIYVRGDFEGPLRAVLTQNSGAFYGAAMAMKGKTMSLIMNSPLIHNAVEWGRALPSMPGKVATFKVYFEGNRAKNDVAAMTEAIDAGLVPIGKRFFNQDITSIMESPDLTPGRSWTAKVLGFVPGLFDEGAGNAVKSAIDKAGDFWHNTLLWDRVADLQMGLYSNFRNDLLAKGVDRQTSARVAAHWANRYAGALPQEAMSDNARKVANMLLFSRSFTMGNLGAMKDMLTGLPKDVIAQIERDAGFGAGAIERAEPGAAGDVAAFTKSMARRKAMAIVALDMGLMYVGNSILQSAINVMRGDHTMDQEMHGYADRFATALTDVKEHPLKLLQPLDFLSRVSSTSENEPGKQDRIRIGYAKDGTAIYARNPAGKIGEEFIGYMTGPLDMLRRKLGTVARPAWQILANDAGFGRKVYDPNADVPEKYLKNLGLIAAHLVKSQLPEGQIGAASDLIKGEGDPTVNKLQAFGPIAGVTFSKGAPGGPAIGEMYQAKAMHNYAVDAALPDIRRQIQRGDMAGAQARMTELGVPPGLQRFYIKTSLNPATRLGGRTLRDFYLYATPEQRQRMEQAPRP